MQTTIPTTISKGHIMRAMQFTRSPFEVMPHYAVATAGAGTLTGSIEIHLKIPGKLIPAAFENPHPAVVLRKLSDDSIAASTYFDFRAMTSQPCWDEPGGCPQMAVLPPVPYDSYTVSFEVHDDVFRQTRGAGGNHEVIGYYAGPQTEAPSKTMNADRRHAATVTVNSANPHPVVDMSTY